MVDHINNKEWRARQICISNNIDPDSRIQKEGTSKTMPAWCLFLDNISIERATNASIEIKVVGDHDDNTVEQLRECIKTGDVAGAVLCADGHLGYSQPVGGVIAYRNQVSISGVGFDIACGNMAVKLDTKYSDIADRAPVILNDIRKNISFGVGRANSEKVKHSLFDRDDLWKGADVEDLRKKAEEQLGTVGSGNHYVDLFYDKDDFVWIGVHFGSRGLGHSIASKYLRLVGGKDGMNVPASVVSCDSDVGQAYLAGMELAGLYAYAGREWVVEKVRSMIGGNVLFSVHNHHNYAWKETHNGEDLWVVRKGSTPALPYQYGFVGGSMGENAVIIRGVDSDRSKELLYSTVHGAGRVLGRKAAIKSLSKSDWDEWMKKANVLLSGGDLDESPMAYKRLKDVLAHHHDTIEIVHELKPFVVVMAGKGDFDPYKD